jgi:hypothetical protein
MIQMPECLEWNNLSVYDICIAWPHKFSSDYVKMQGIVMYWFWGNFIEMLKLIQLLCGFAILFKNNHVHT